MAVGVDLNIMEPPHICQDEDSLQVGGCRCVCVCVVGLGVIEREREKKRIKQQSKHVMV